MPVMGRSKARPDFTLVSAVLTDLGQLVYEDRERTGVTVGQQAAAIGVTPGELSDLLAGASRAVPVLDYLGSRKL